MSLPLIWFLGLLYYGPEPRSCEFHLGKVCHAGLPVGRQPGSLPLAMHALLGCSGAWESVCPGLLVSMGRTSITAPTWHSSTPPLCAPHYPCVLHSSVEVKSEHMRNHQNSRKRQIFG